MKTEVSYNTVGNKFEVLNEVEMGNVLGGGPKGSTREQDVFDPDEE